MKIVRTPEEAFMEAARLKISGSLALIPTMGALHEGHLHLVRLAKTVAAKTVVSVFVNPLQFSANEDFGKYPRTFELDCQKLEKEGVDLLFAPLPERFYPVGFSTKVAVSGVSKHLCGEFRPGHFDGVATVCLKLFQSTGADLAIFGEKDFQQIRVIEHMVLDLNLPLKIVRCKTVRDEDGLALSSRNNYLSISERALTRAIPESLQRARSEALIAGLDISAGTLVQLTRTALELRSLNVEYCEITSEIDLAPVTSMTKLEEIVKPRLFVAVRCGMTRLIDNISLEKEG